MVVQQMISFKQDWFTSTQITSNAFVAMMFTILCCFSFSKVRIVSTAALCSARRCWNSPWTGGVLRTRHYFNSDIFLPFLAWVECVCVCFVKVVETDGLRQTELTWQIAWDWVDRNRAWVDDNFEKYFDGKMIKKCDMADTDGFWLCWNDRLS